MSKFKVGDYVIWEGDGHKTLEVVTYLGTNVEDVETEIVKILEKNHLFQYQYKVGDRALVETDLLKLANFAKTRLWRVLNDN